MKNYTKEEKSKIKKQIRKAMKAGTFTLAGFAREYGCNVKTIRGIIQSSSKLTNEYNKYQETQDASRKANAQSHASGKVGSKQAKDAPFVKEIERDEDKSKGTVVITTRSLDIKTIEDALRIAEVDLDVWKVDRAKVNSWEVTMGVKSIVGKLTETHAETYTNFQVTLWLVRKAPEVLAFEDLVKRLESASPVVPIIAFHEYTKVVPDEHQRELEISLADIHLGLRCLAPCSDIDWSPDIADKMVMSVIDGLIESAKSFGPFERIIFPFGNDFMHTDNVFNTTTAGTFQPEGDAWKSTMLHGEVLAMAMIDRMEQEAPVKVIVVPGNHAMQTEISMGRTLLAYYHNDENVQVDANMSSYKFHKYGVNLLGFEHGHSIRQTLRLSGLMANECPEWWAETKYREWHCGDQHRKGSGRPSVMAEQGVGVEFLPSLVPANEWHKVHAFSWQKRIGMAFVWDKTAGPVARLQTNIDSYTNEIMR
ncbi:hypothetical protein LCGC14_0377820 [marine sediment metagenome]|uniref:Calcineurin-like phosphoesterase domain-containing protein n=1 Tax=marine sediment metagenome TaxID=412755 RepID=A0A0F9T8Z9_9ZZZZ